MNDRIVRWVDKWVGIIICYVLTVFEKIRAKVFSNKRDYTPKKILFLSVVELGALSVAYSAIKSAKRNFPEADIFIFTTERGEELAEIMGFKEENRIVISSLEEPVKFILGSIKAILKLNKLGIDAAVCLEPYLRYSAIMSYLSGAKVRSGFHNFAEEGNYIGNLFTHKLIYNPHIHVGLSYVSLVEALIEKRDNEPKVKRHIDSLLMERFIVDFPSSAKDRIWQILKAEYSSIEGKKLIILNPNGKDDENLPLRRWPDQNYVTLANKLLHSYNAVVLLTGEESERSHNTKIMEKIGHIHVVNLAGVLNIRELLYLYCVSHLLITNDSGPAHFASMTNIPLIVFYGPETPEIFGALSPNTKMVYKNFACSPCLSVYNAKKSKCTDNQCLKTIDVDEIYLLSKQVLDSSN